MKKTVRLESALVRLALNEVNLEENGLFTNG